MCAGFSFAITDPASATGGTAPGDLDPTFGTNGIAMQAVPAPGYSGSGFQGSAATRDPSGRFVLAAGAMNVVAGFVIMVMGAAGAALMFMYRCDLRLPCFFRI